MSLEITFDKTISTTVLVKEMIDNPELKTVTAKTNFGVLVLWKNDEYDAIGTWSDKDVLTRIEELYNKPKEEKGKEAKIEQVKL